MTNENMYWVKVEMTKEEYEIYKAQFIAQKNRFRGGRLLRGKYFKGVDKARNDDKHYPLEEYEIKDGFMYLFIVFTIMIVFLLLFPPFIKWIQTLNWS